MVFPKQSCVVLFAVWLASFYVLWYILCMLDFATVAGIRKRNSKSVMDSNATIEDVSVQVSPSDNSKPPRYSDEWLKQITNNGFDLQKELREIQKRSSCQPVENILFVKTHKTAGSTVTNIINRFADLRELLVALPVGGTYRFMWPRKFHWTATDILRLDGETANALSNHARYDRRQMDIIMKKGTKYISILREPVSQFHSSFYYFEFDKMFRLQHTKNPLEEFLRDPDKHLYDLSMRLGDLPEETNLVQNGMFFDLGYDFLDFGNETVVRNAIGKLERELDLVMIMEYFDESLVLIMREFCWSIDDVLYIKLNQMKYKRTQLTQGLKAKIRNWNSADVALYNSFNRTFWKKIKKHGKGFWEDVAEFKRRNAEILKICSLKEIEEKGFKLNVTVKGLVMNSKVDRYHRYYCQKMIMNEIQYVDYFRIKFSNSFGYQEILKREGLGRKKTGELKRKLIVNLKGRFKILGGG